MAKYSDKFKLKVVKEYLEGTLSYKLLAMKYGIPAESQLKNGYVNFPLQLFSFSSQ